MTKQLPERPSLDHLRKQAKALLDGFQTGDSDALARIAQSLPSAQGAPPVSFALHDAQSVVAREYGFASWARLKAHVERVLGMPTLIEFTRATLGGRLDAAREALRREPNLASEDLSVAAMIGDADAVEAALARNPEAVNSPAGVRGWPPLVYACFSRFLGAEERPRVVEAARILLEHGADPNGSFLEERYPELPETCLYGASGVNNCPELTEALLKAGANPTDGEALYHSTEHLDLKCLRLLFQYGAKSPGSNTVAHMLDSDCLDGLRLLLENDPDPAEVDRAQFHAILRGRAPEFLRLLLEHGANLEARNDRGMTPLTMAWSMGHEAAAEFYVAQGANADQGPEWALVAACARADEAAAQAVVAAHPDVVSRLEPIHNFAVPAAAERHAYAALELMLRMGFDVAGAGAIYDAHALHWAALHGDVPMVNLLLGYHAPLNHADRIYQAAPLGWAIEGSTWSNNRNGDYVAVVRALVQAGTDLSRKNKWGKSYPELAKANPEIAKVLES